MKRIALVVLIALNALCSVFAAPTKEWRMPDSWDLKTDADGVVLSAAEEKDLADLVQRAKRSVAGRILKDARGNSITLEEFEKFARKQFLKVVLRSRMPSLAEAALRESSSKFESGMPVVKHSDGNGKLQKSRQPISAPSVAENPVESKNHVVMNQPVSGSAEAKPSAQTDEGWKWNGWKIASVVFLVLGIMGVKSSSYQERICGVVSIAASGTLYYVGCSPDPVASGTLYYVGCSPDPVASVRKVCRIVAIGVGGLLFFAFLILLFFAIVKVFIRGFVHEKLEEKPARRDESIIHCLDAGPNGEIRRKLQMEQQPLCLEKAKCRLYVPKDWDSDVRVLKGSEVGLEVDEDMTCDAIAVLAGPREHEWITICHDVDHGSGPGVLVDEIMDFKLIDILMDGIMLIPHPVKAVGVRSAKRIAWGNAYLCDSRYLKFHRVDDDAADVRTGAFEIDGRMYRIISVAFARKNDCWRFEYAFPAADGVTPESLDLRAEEIESARRIFVPIETFP